MKTSGISQTSPVTKAGDPSTNQIDKSNSGPSSGVTADLASAPQSTKGIKASKLTLNPDQAFKNGVVDIVNTFRSNPKSAAKLVKLYVSKNQLSEGEQDSAKGAIKFLKGLDKKIEAGKLELPPLKPSDTLSEISQKGAKKLALASDSEFDHDFIEGPRNEYAAHYENNIKANPENQGKLVIGRNLENLHASTDPKLTPLDVVVSWIIDHDVPGAGHRTALFDQSTQEMGIGKANSQDHGNVTVLNFIGFVAQDI